MPSLPSHSPSILCFALSFISLSPSIHSSLFLSPAILLTLFLYLSLSQIRIVDENFTCSPLDGHTDIVLAADVSPDG